MIALNRILAAVAAIAFSVQLAIAGTISVLDGGGTARTYQVITNGSANFVGMFGLCDGVAAAQCVAVKAASTAALVADPSLVVTISPNTATLPVSAASWPLPTGAATAALQTTMNTTLGSPFQAGGSIGNTAFGVSGTLPAFAAAPTVLTTPQTAAFTKTGCSVTTSSAQCLAGATAVNHVQIQNTSVSASIACNWGGTAILNSAAGSFMLSASQSSLWGPTTSGIPSGALNCIGSGAAQLYIEYN